jgi:hypothetical protein
MVGRASESGRDGADVIIIEMGAGLGVPTIRIMSEDFESSWAPD